MPGTLRVALGETPVGTLTNIAGDYNVFAFAPEYLEDPSRPVLSQSLIDLGGEPIRIVPRTHTVAPPFFANLLPEEGSVLRGLIARQQRLRPAPDFPFLRVLGSDLPGAVILSEPEARMEPTPPFDDESLESARCAVVESSRAEALESSRAEALESARAEALESPAPIRFSLAGMQLKFSTRLLEDRFAVTDYAGGEAWIVKMPTNAYPRLPENEFTIMTLARAIGLDVPEIRLRGLASVTGMPADLPALRADEPRLVYAIKRFDRVAGGRRIHVEDFNQITAQQPRDKYEHRTASSIANILAQLCEPADVDEFVRRLVFGIVVGNDDMHLKNWAVAYLDGRRASLAPMYDFVCSRLYFPAGKLALTVGGEREFSRITLDAMRDFARRAEISAKRVAVLVREVVERVRAAWPAVAERTDDRDLVAAVERHFAQVPIFSAG